MCARAVAIRMLTNRVWGILITVHNIDSSSFHSWLLKVLGSCKLACKSYGWRMRYHEMLFSVVQGTVDSFITKRESKHFKAFAPKMS